MKPPRKMTALLCGLLSAASLTLPGRAAVRSIPVQVDGTLLSGVSYLESGVTYVPLRTLLDAFGGWDISWDSQLHLAAAVSEDCQLTADPTANTVTVNDITRAGKVYIQNGRTYVPLRLVMELLEGSAEWDPYLGGAAATSAEAEHNAVDLYWLARIISAESQGESLTGQIAVGNVVLNRVANGEFPDTISAVIFDRTDGVQFEPVSNGTVYQSPTEQSVEAALRALEGETPVGGALYFYAPALSSGTWVNANRTYLTTIGCHRFYL